MSKEKAPHDWFQMSDETPVWYVLYLRYLQSEKKQLTNIKIRDDQKCKRFVSPFIIFPPDMTMID